MLGSTLTGKPAIGFTGRMRKAATVGRIARAARWIVVPLATLLGVARLLVTGGCAVGEESPPASRGCLFRDPSLHRVVVHGCETSLDCPEGTACAPGDWTRDDDRWAECTDPDGGERSCRATTLGFVTAAALTQGFGVPEMKITRSDQSGVAVHSWIAPEQAVTVVCALFGSPPSFQPSETRKDASGKPVIEMTNFRESVLVWRAFASDRSSATIADLLGPAAGSIPRELDPAPQEERGSLGSSVFALGCGTQSQGSGSRYSAGCPRPTTSLSFGCWAYGPTEIVAASLTFSVDPSEQASQGWVLGEGECADMEHGEPTDGRACVLPLPEGVPQYIPFFGTCRDGQCVNRCARDEDCCPTILRTAGSGAGGSGGLTTSTGVGGAGGMTSTGVGGSGGLTTSTGDGGGCPEVCLCPKLGRTGPQGRPFVGQCGAPADGDLIDSEACTFSGFTTVSGGATGGTSP